MKKFIGDKAFYKETISIALPIMVQQFITSFVNLIDNIMIGSIGGIALTAVTVSNRFYLIFNSTLFGACGAAGIYIAQYFGAKEKKRCQEVFNLSLLVVLLLGGIFTLVLFIMPESIVRLFSNTPEIVEESMNYIQYARYTYFPYGISFACILALRSVGINTVQLKVGSLAVLINTVLNYCLIFGNFGFPEMGIQGAAIATVVARVVEAIVYLVIIYRKRHFFSLDLKGIIKPNIDLVVSMARKGLPLTINEILFSLGLAMVFKSYMRSDEYLVAAIAVVDTVTNIMFIIFAGLSSAVSIMVGKRLGAGMLDDAKDNASKLIFFGLCVAIVFGTICAIAAAYIPMFYNVDAEIRQTITILLRVKSFMIIFYVVNVCVFFVLRAGGDTVSTLLLDAGFLWLGAVLVSTVLSIYTTLPLVMLYIIVESLDIIKLFVAVHFFKKGKWIKNITVG